MDVPVSIKLEQLLQAVSNSQNLALFHGTYQAVVEEHMLHEIVGVSMMYVVKSYSGGKQ